MDTSTEQQATTEQPATPPALDGVLERVKFSGRDGWIIGTVWTGKERVTVKGTLPDTIHEGDDVSLAGRWVVDPKYGKQFDFVAASPAKPSSAGGVRKWIARWIDGIGERGASLLVERFGLDAPKVLEARPDSGDDPLLELPGFDAEKAAAARASYAALEGHPQAQLWLAEHGIVGAFAGRLVKKYEAETRTVLEGDPYRPMADVDGFGFKRCDEFAKKLGVLDGDPRRARAAVLFTFETEAGNGHVYLSQDELVRDAAKDLAVPIDATQEAIGVLLAEGAIVEEGKVEKRLYATPLRDAEASICFDVLRLLEAARSIPPLNFVPDARLNEEQQGAVELAAKNGVILMIGGPGTGKSHTLKAIIDQVDPDRRSTLLMAPTGKAAKRMAQATGMEAKTIHRGLEFGPIQGAAGACGFGRHRGRPFEQRLVVLDEFSMCDTVLAASLLEAVGSGSRLILVGDADQLPSVGPGTVLRDLIDCELVPVARLVKNMRSAEGGGIARAAAKVVAGERLEDEDLLGDVTLLQVENSETVAAEVVRLVAGGEGAIKGYALQHVQVLCPKRIGPAGSVRMNELIQEKVNPARPGVAELTYGDATYRVGDKVLIVKNDYDLDVFNGDSGRVVKADSVQRRLRVDLDDGRSLVFDKEHLKLLQLAYAISVHKSQGSEYPVVVMPVHGCDGRMLYRNLLYTGLTRARERVYLVGERKALSRAVRCDDPMKRNTSLWGRIRHLAQKAKEGEGKVETSP